MDDLKSALQAAMEEFWSEQTLDVDAGTECVDELVAAMDSLTATEVLEKLEDLVGMELPSGELIRRGGYDSKEQFISELTQEILDYVVEHKK